VIIPRKEASKLLTSWRQKRAAAGPQISGE
jgi:hypothetical protein